MAVTMTTFDNALKDLYEGLVRDQINTTSTPLYNKIETTERNIEGGRKVVKVAPYGLNGGVGAFSEDGALPTSGGNKYVQFVSYIKNLAGVIKFTDKVVKASKSDRAAFVDAMKSEMDGLLKAAKFGYARQLYGDGTGHLTATGTMASGSVTVPVTSVQYLVEGMIIDLVDADGAAITGGSQRRVKAVNKGASPTIVLEGTTTVQTASTGFVVEQGSYDKEITGLEAIMAQTGTLYGLDKATYPWLKPNVTTTAGALSDKLIIDKIIDIENSTGGSINMLMCHPLVYTSYYDYLEATKRNVNTMKLDGGFSALSVSGRPMAQDRFVAAQTMELLDTSVFKLHVLSDWEWMQNDGAILKWVAGYAQYQAVLVKYAELICDHPGAQGRLAGITLAS